VQHLRTPLIGSTEHLGAVSPLCHRGKSSHDGNNSSSDAACLHVQMVLVASFLLPTRYQVSRLNIQSKIAGA
jgi:hypothetical protein